MMPNKLTKEELAAIQARCDAATQGQWCWREERGRFWLGSYVSGKGLMLILEPHRKGLNDATLLLRDHKTNLMIPFDYDHPDAKAIRDAQNDRAALLAHISAQDAELAAARDGADRAAWWASRAIDLLKEAQRMVGELGLKSTIWLGIQNGINAIDKAIRKLGEYGGYVPMAKPDESALAEGGSDAT